jgi:NOL1/NOP2/fmu family ribosome biogenesis protein
MATKFLCISTGFGLAEERGKFFAPQHSLSMSKALRQEAFPALELTLENALAFLRTEALPMANLPLGLLMVTYHGIPLGFVKNVGARCNNLYPNEWRIRKL